MRGNSQLKERKTTNILFSKRRLPPGGAPKINTEITIDYSDEKINYITQREIDTLTNNYLSSDFELQPLLNALNNNRQYNNLNEGAYQNLKASFLEAYFSLNYKNRGDNFSSQELKDYNKASLNAKKEFGAWLDSTLEKGKISKVKLNSYYPLQALLKEGNPSLNPWQQEEIGYLKKRIRKIFFSNKKDRFFEKSLLPELSKKAKEYNLHYNSDFVNTPLRSDSKAYSKMVQILALSASQGGCKTWEPYRIHPEKEGSMFVRGEKWPTQASLIREVVQGLKLGNYLKNERH